MRIASAILIMAGMVVACAAVGYWLGDVLGCFAGLCVGAVLCGIYLGTVQP